MKIKFSKIFEGAAHLSFDDEGVESELRAAIFNTAYELFLAKFDSIRPEQRMRTLNFISESDGNSIENLGEESVDDFFRPSDVRETNNLGSDGKPLKVLETKDFYDPEQRWFLDDKKIYFLNYDEGTQFKVRYKPQFIEVDSSFSGDTEIWIPTTAVLPKFRQFIIAIFEAIEEETQTAAQAAPHLFEQYFDNLEEMLDAGKMPNITSFSEINQNNF